MLVLPNLILPDENYPRYPGPFLRKISDGEPLGKSAQTAYGGEGGILCQGPRGLENCCKISDSGQPRRVACTGSMYWNRYPSSSGIGRIVNAFHRRVPSTTANRIVHGSPA